MSYRVIIEEPAQAEVEDALRWMAQHSPEAAALWHFDLTEAIESFQNSPRRCPLAYENEEFDEEIRHLIFGKYRILFTIRDESVYILHVRHSARKPFKRQDGP
jgi:plasmid stabilization system protein ParE